MSGERNDARDMRDAMVMTQRAPYPHDLADMVKRMRARPGWSFRLKHMDRGQGSEGLTLVITVETVNSYDHRQPIVVNHLWPVPPAAYLAGSWRRWLLDMCMLTDRHEMCEFFAIDDDHPFAPLHGPGEDPYRIVELVDDEQRRTSFRGVVNARGTVDAGDPTS